MRPQEHLKEVVAFLQEHRNNEGHFNKIYSKLEDEINNSNGMQQYQSNLQDVKEKEAPAYLQMQQTGGTAYPEFEKFTAGFEKAVVAALKEVENKR